MDNLFLYAAILLIVLIILLLYRIIVGPTVIDRILAVNVIGTKSIVILVLMGIIFKRIEMFVDIAIGYGLLNFIASLAAAKYFKKHKKLQVQTELNNNQTQSDLSEGSSQ
ncbi:MAG: monovalent cation/H+ antiporter complex subunit F [Candidatus Marinamargulisbacteria bacterium]